MKQKKRFLPILPALAPLKMVGVLTSVAKYWKEILVLLMAATIYYQNFMDTELLKWVGIRTIPGVKQELVVTKEQLEQCELSRVELKAAIESTNAQIQKWSALSQSLQQKHDSVVAEITALKKKSTETVSEILNEPTPKTCEAAIDYLKQGAKEELKWKK